MSGRAPSVGNRALLAKTCTKCERLLGAEMFYMDGATGRRKSRCRSCESSKGRQSRSRRAPTPGGRTVLAKTCIHCGLLLDARWFGDRGEPSRPALRSTCRRCDARSRRRRASSPTTAAYKKAKMAEFVLRKESQHQPVKGGQPYTEADHKVLADPELTLDEKALTLGRSYRAVAVQCSLFGYASKLKLDDSRKPEWVINTPLRDT